MRKTINPQLHLGEVDISAIQFDLRSRDDIPRILRGLQHIYTTPRIRQTVFSALENMIPESIDKKMEDQAWTYGEYWFLVHFVWL